MKESVEATVCFPSGIQIQLWVSTLFCFNKKICRLQFHLWEQGFLTFLEEDIESTRILFIFMVRYNLMKVYTRLLLFFLVKQATVSTAIADSEPFADIDYLLLPTFILDFFHSEWHNSLLFCTWFMFTLKIIIRYGKVASQSQVSIHLITHNMLWQPQIFVVIRINLIWPLGPLE